MWTRPAPEGMVYVTALLPLAQGIGVYATLKRQADVCGDGRGRGQVMADTLYERITGRPAQAPVPVAVNLVMADTTLFGGDDCPGRVTGYGPVPAVVLRDAGHDAHRSRGENHAAPALPPPPQRAVGRDGIAGADLPQRVGPLHRVAGSDLPHPLLQRPDPPHRPRHPRPPGGPTTARNGLGECEACNYTKEAPGWTVSTSDTHGAHTAAIPHPHRRGLPQHRTPTTRTTADPHHRDRGAHQHCAGESARGLAARRAVPATLAP